MHSLLIYIPKPEEKDYEQLHKWNNAAENVARRAKQISGAEWLGGCSMLIRANSGLPHFGNILREAENQGLSCKVLFIEEATEWSDPKPT